MPWGYRRLKSPARVFLSRLFVLSPYLRTSGWTSLPSCLDFASLVFTSVDLASVDYASVDFTFVDSTLFTWTPLMWT